MRPGGATAGGERPRGREKKACLAIAPAGCRLHRHADRRRIIPPICVYCWDPVPCLILAVVRRASAAHALGGCTSTAAAGPVGSKEAFNPDASRHGEATPPPEILDRRIWGSTGLCAQRAEGTTSRHWSGKASIQPECGLIRGYIDHVRLQIDQARTGVCCRASGSPSPGEGVHHAFDPHTRWISMAQARADAAQNWRLRSAWSRPSTTFILHHREAVVEVPPDVDVAVPMTSSIPRCAV